MAISLNKARVSPIAIDFGADTLKLLQVAPGRPPHLVAAAAATLPSNTRQKPLERLTAISEALKSLLRQAPFRGRRVICAIPAFQTLTQQLTLPATDSVKADELVQNQLRERLGIEPRGMVLRHFPLGGVAYAPGGKRPVVCIAASRQSVMQYIDLCRQCKLEVIGMHAEPFALLEANRGEVADPAEPARAVIDIGAMTTKLLVIRGGKLLFAKSIHLGGDQLTRQLASERGIDFDDARRLRAVGETAGTHTPAATPAAARVKRKKILAALDGDEDDDGLSSFMDPDDEASWDDPATPRDAPTAKPHANADTLDCLLDELRMGLRSYHGSCPDVPVEKLIFVGGEAQDCGMCTSLARELGLAAVLGDPLGGVVHLGQSRTAGIDFDDIQPAWAVARGLVSSEANV
ncbi:MAG: pilus assembly protein PilM [Phycisphaeraceae bacterium]